MNHYFGVSTLLVMALLSAPATYANESGAFVARNAQRHAEWIAAQKEKREMIAKTNDAKPSAAIEKAQAATVQK